MAWPRFPCRRSCTKASSPARCSGSASPSVTTRSSGRRSVCRRCDVGYVFPLVILVAAISGAASLAGQERPLPDEDALFRDARENIARATRLQSGYAYKERRTELHMNPFGRLGTGGTLLYDVTPTEDGA